MVVPTCENGLFFARIYFGYLGTLAPQIFTLARDSPRLASTHPEWGRVSPKKVLTVYHLNECSVLVTSWNWTKYRPTLTLWQLIAPLLFTGLGLGFALWFAFGSPEGLRLDSNELVSNLTRLLGISTVDYCNSLLARVPYYQLDRLQSVLNTATRLIVGAKKHDHIKHVLWDRLHWLPVPQRIQFKQWIWSIFC